MTKHLLSLVLLLVLSSCATVFTKKTYEMEVSSQTYSMVKVNDSSFFLPAKIEVKRSKEDLAMVFSNDSISRSYLLKSSISPKYLYGNLAFVHFAPVGYLVDLSNEKRFYYGSHIVANTNDTLTQINTPVTKGYKNFKKRIHHYFTKEYQTDKGQLQVIVSLPGINSFHFKPMNESAQNNSGFLGIAAGLEYFYKEKNFFGFYASAIIDFEAPFPVPIEYDGEHELLESLNIGLTNNHKLNRFTIGYGLNYAKNTWVLSNDEYDPLVEGSKKPVTKSNNSLGLIANGYFQFGKRFFVGLNYKPSLMVLNNTPKLNYEHVISLDFVWKFNIKE